MTRSHPGFEARRPAVAALPAGRLAVAVSSAIRDAGCDVAEPVTADGLVWCKPSPGGLEELLAASPEVRWVQLPFAGIEKFLALMARRDDIVWTCAKGIYGPAVAEFALGALIASMRRLDRYATMRTWEAREAASLLDARVVIFGGGGIGRCLAAMLVPFGSEVTVVRRSDAPVEGARVVCRGPAADEAVADADAVVLALALTSETTGLVDAAFLDRMRTDAWLVNVARGAHVVTDDLVHALEAGGIAGAVLDVTDPEPLPADHRLWQLDNCLVTPHVANTSSLADPELVKLVGENCRRFAAGDTLEALVDPAVGY